MTWKYLQHPHPHRSQRHNPSRNRRALPIPLLQRPSDRSHGQRCVPHHHPNRPLPLRGPKLRSRKSLKLKTTRMRHQQSRPSHVPSHVLLRSETRHLQWPHRPNPRLAPRQPRTRRPRRTRRRQKRRRRKPTVPLALNDLSTRSSR
ncbi:hypothetical protein RSOL_209190 [Rhizoctonia solani AG-3 Rhs1AP]|uniref:Uncharacterized protein n=1 Tax=Rhizoctonia solani AG-3 Rhs1AP TaxID=1086054 RepID=X8J6I1_9AGAM|nr:hypothetical protein RSOL_209190 [Rhizoctonia solani AG-3 Rhs1AP]